MSLSGQALGGNEWKLKMTFHSVFVFWSDTPHKLTKVNHKKKLEYSKSPAQYIKLSINPIIL